MSSLLLECHKRTYDSFTDESQCDQCRYSELNIILILRKLKEGGHQFWPFLVRKLDHCHGGNTLCDSISDLTVLRAKCRKEGLLDGSTGFCG
jgi:hypothetical protein